VDQSYRVAASALVGNFVYVHGLDCAENVGGRVERFFFLGKTEP